MLEPLEVEIRTLHAILGSDRDPDGRAFAPLADAYRRSGNPRKAFGLLRDGLARLPDFTTGHVVAARLYMEQGLIEEGELAARRALALDPGNVAAMATLAGVLLAADRASEAEEWLVSLDVLEPEVLDEHGLERPAPRAPDDEEVWDIARLAPDAPAVVDDVDEEIWDIAALAPDGWSDDREQPHAPAVAAVEEEAAEEEVVDIALLAPDGASDADAPVEVEVPALVAAAEEASADADAGDGWDVWDVSALAPDEADTEGEEAALEVVPTGVGEAGFEAPGAEAVDSAPSDDEPAVQAPPAVAAAARTEPAAGAAPRIYTRTLGELYARQGFLDRAVEVFRQLRADQPDDPGIAERLGELEAEMAGHRPGRAATAAERGSAAPARSDVPAATPAPTPSPTRNRDEELEALARDLVGHAERQPDIDTPFAWTEDVDADADAADASPADPGPSIGTYFDDLLRWRPEERS